MSIFIEKAEFTRRQFFKGAGMLAGALAFTGIFAKIGLLAGDAKSRYIEKRAAALYSLDEKMAIRRSHENPEIAQIYKEFLSPGEVAPLSHKSERLLHTKYGNKIPALIEELQKPETEEHAAEGPEHTAA